MGLFKKLGRGIRRVAKKNIGGARRLLKRVGPGLVLNAALPIAAPITALKAVSAAKSLGRKLRGIETPKSLAPVVRAAAIAVRKKRDKMPGGANVPNVAPVGLSLMSSAPQAKRRLYERKPRRTQTQPASRAGKARKAPSAKQLAARAAFAARARAAAARRRAG